MSRKHRSLGRRWWTGLFAVMAIASVALYACAGAAVAASPECQAKFTGPGKWSEGSHWRNAKEEELLPTATEVACIEGGSVTVDVNNAEAASIKEGSVVIPTGGSLALASTTPVTDESILSELKLTGGTVSSEGPVTLTAGLNLVNETSTLKAAALKLVGGTLMLNGTATAPVTVEAGAILTGSGGKLAGGLVNAGTVEPLGVGELHVEGKYEQTSAGTLAIEVTAPGVSGKLTVTEAATLAGTILVRHGETYAPKVGDEAVTVVSATAGVNGPFTTIVSPEGTRYEQHLSPEVSPTQVQLLLVERTPRLKEGEPPAISSPAGLSAGSTVTCAHGGWEEKVDSFAYHWLRDSTPIAEGENHVLSAADQGHSLICTVAATNQAGTSPVASSAAVAVPVPAVEPVKEPTPTPPANTAAPTIAGILVVGQTIACQPGSWSASPTGFSYQWYRDGTVLPGAIASTYTVLAVDQAHSLSCSIAASNAAGASAAAKSEARIVPRLTPLPLACSKLVVQLLSIRRSGGSLVVSGVALARYAGQKVTIKAVTVPRGVGAPGGTATVTADGTFVTRVHAPSGPQAGRVRYAATLMGSKSPVLALAQPLQLVREGKTRIGVRLTLKGTGVLAKGRHKVTVARRETCTKSATLLKVKLGRGGVMTVTLPLPEAGALAFYEVATPVPGNRSYALAIAVPGLGG